MVEITLYKTVRQPLVRGESGQAAYLYGLSVAVPRRSSFRGES